MSKLIPFFKKFALAALVLAIGLAALLAAGASGVVPVSARGAAGLQDETTPPANRPANGVIPVLAKQSRFLRISPGSRTGHGTRGTGLPAPGTNLGPRANCLPAPGRPACQSRRVPHQGTASD